MTLETLFIITWIVILLFLFWLDIKKFRNKPFLFNIRNPFYKEPVFFLRDNLINCEYFVKIFDKTKIDKLLSKVETREFLNRLYGRRRDENKNNDSSSWTS